MRPWQKLPLSKIRETMEIEQKAGRYHRPVYRWFRTFARREGSLIRFLLLATLSDPNTNAEDILGDYSEDGWQGLYAQESPLEERDILLVDPMMGSGTTILEGARLGLEVIGLDYNPVLWWVLTQTLAEPITHDEGFESFLEGAQEEVSPFFESREGETVLAYLMALTIECSACGNSMELHPNYEISRGRDGYSVYLCPNTDCEQRVFESKKDPSEQVECESCSTTFSPENGNFQRGTYRCECGYQERLTEHFDQQDDTPSFERYAVYYEDENGVRRYREMKPIDERTVSRAKEAYYERFAELPIPRSKIQDGEITSRLLDFNYDRYHQLFTERQRLVLGLLLDIADTRHSQDLSERFATHIISTLQYNNTLTSWNPNIDTVSGVFRLSDHRIQVETVEANPLATQWKGSVESARKRYSEAKSYLTEPYERLRSPSGELESIPLPNEGSSRDNVNQLSVSSADNLDTETQSVDCVVVDPPYYNNVQYGELLDFYYVWLREILKNDYEEFSATHVPKLREISVNRKRGKDEEYYRRALRNSFEEIHRILEFEGDLICLFHIGSQEAWLDLTTILVRTGFQIQGAIPLQDLSQNTGRNAQSFDIVLFAEKTAERKEISFETIRQNLIYEMSEIAAEERSSNPDLSEDELQIILRARGLSEFSAHYPNVLVDEETVDPERAIQEIDRFVREN